MTSGKFLPPGSDPDEFFQLLDHFRNRFQPFDEVKDALVERHPAPIPFPSASGGRPTPLNLTPKPLQSRHTRARRCTCLSHSQTQKSDPRKCPQ